MLRNSIIIYRGQNSVGRSKRLRQYTIPLILCIAYCLFWNAAFANIESFRTRLHQLNEKNWDESDIVMEIKFGREISARILSKYKLLEDKKLTRYINLVGSSIALHSQREELNYHFAILDDNSLDAYSAPGGYIFISRGLLNFVNDEAELAGILAHEIAHISLRHIVNEFNIKGSSREELSSLARFIGASANTTNAAFSQAIDEAMTLLFDSGFEKSEELQADNRATLLLANTGYDPSGLLRILSRIKQAKTNNKNSVTHPSFNKRFNRMSTLLKQNTFASGTYYIAKSRFFNNMHSNTAKGFLYHALPSP